MGEMASGEGQASGETAGQTPVQMTGQMPRQMSRALLVVLALAAGFAIVPRVTRGCGSAMMNEEAPDFTASVVANGANLPGVADPTTLTLSELHGKPVLLDFWATWCGPCQMEMPVVNGLASRFRDQGLVVVGVNTSDQQGLAERLVARRGFGFPIVYDANNDIARKFHVENLPTLVVVSKDGKITAVRHGVTSDADLERLVKQVL